ncbi:hypothetical protein BBK36DRAFT_154006 [Trichoderma citrinoviride]|uniref:Peroxin/Ferlin domain-containing protein n=1 Tax=Trichoderma citrinoviride TaxID=58853 RepID=A0A2T4BHC9_9HYPO|nr:hypothetical protein BBK36DRAFT_154006 [Trichoderma citrinoviride]PTB68649.1 hypothetical protein BBK36DRAFT_154006 [Trichoderma citrinoviride]
MHGSRRTANLQPGDYDHEITITDDEAAQSLRATSSVSVGGDLVPTNTSTRLLSSDGEPETEQGQEQQPPDGRETERRDHAHLHPSASKGKDGATTYQATALETTSELGQSHSSVRPSIEIRAPSVENSQHTSNWDARSRPKSREKPETAIDILYENERGGFMCGIPLFSSAALGCLDPTPWTNAYHHPSPTDIHTAQVPDPSWEWVWPEWRINHQDGMDEGGWEYSFAFQRPFSWHGPTWWNSFVRRRAWIRMRARRRPEDLPADPNLLAGVDYFKIRPASVLGPPLPGSVAGSRVPSRVPSKVSLTQASSAGHERERPDIEDMDMLLQALRSARIDREKWEAIENYVEHAIDLSELQHKMHEIMSLFVFQQSRRQLLSYLMQKHDEIAKAWEEDKSPELKRRKEALDAATKHAEEEVCKLAYWSDVKQMAESGELRDVVDSCEGLGTDAWQGLDKSAPEPPRNGKMPQKAAAEAARAKKARNRMFRQAFTDRSPARLRDAERKLASPYVPTVRDYPSAYAAKESRTHALQVARVQVAFDEIWRHFGHGIPDWSETFNLLKRMMTRRSEPSSMAAMRIVLPKSWALELGSKKIEFVDSTTGLLAKLRVSSDHQDPSAIILRGKSSVLANAAEELVAACKDVEVYKLGEVAAFGYEVQRLWPGIEGAADGGSLIPDDKQDNIWVHQEYQTYWIDTPYEEAPRPEMWTMENLDGYIRMLVCGRLRPHLALRYYAKPEKDGTFVDTDGIRVQLIMAALTDEDAKACITPSILKMAMSFMAHKGGHRADADRLLTLAEEWGIPLDTEAYNIMLEGYVTKRDVAFFHKLLLKMQQRYFQPNARTWLLFLELVEKEMERRQIIVAMYDLGLFKDPATRRGIARIMATHDAYVAFRSGKRLDAFMAEQKSRYGDDWFTTDAMNSILTEFFRFHERSHRRFDDFRGLIEKQSEDGRKVGTDTINLVLEKCLVYKDWDTAVWALTKLHESGCEADHLTYQYVIRLAIRLHLPHALGVAVFYAALEYKLRDVTRVILRRLLLGHAKDAFWLDHRPFIMTKDMGRLLMENKAQGISRVVSRVEWAINTACEGYKPSKPLAKVLDLAQRTRDRPLQLRRAFPENFTYEGAHDAKQDMALRMERIQEEEGDEKKPVNVFLTWHFDPRTMVKRWDEEKEMKAREWFDRHVKKEL